MTQTPTLLAAEFLGHSTEEESDGGRRVSHTNRIHTRCSLPSTQAEWGETHAREALPSPSGTRWSHPLTSHRRRPAPTLVPSLFATTSNPPRRLGSPSRAALPASASLHVLHPHGKASPVPGPQVLRPHSCRIPVTYHGGAPREPVPSDNGDRDSTQSRPPGPPTALSMARPLLTPLDLALTPARGLLRGPAPLLEPPPELALASRGAGSFPASRAMPYLGGPVVERRLSRVPSAALLAFSVTTPSSSSALPHAPRAPRATPGHAADGSGRRRESGRLGRAGDMQTLLVQTRFPNFSTCHLQQWHSHQQSWIMPAGPKTTVTVYIT